MALEAVVFPQDPFNYSYMFGLNYGLETEQLDRDFSGVTGNMNWDYSSVMQDVAVKESWDSSNSSPQQSASTGGRRKRRRTKTTKNQEEIESQRMTHIAVERNRRKQMNEYLAILRSLMPPSYVQRVSTNVKKKINLCFIWSFPTLFVSKVHYFNSQIL